MGQFERSLVNAFNKFFKNNGVDGIAYRRKQHRFTSQFLDILVDSPNEGFRLGIENKSIKTSNRRKLYFSQHFSKSEDGHQVERINEFLKRSGRRGFLAVEVRRGRGKPKTAFLLPWKFVAEKYNKGGKGITIEEMKEFNEIERNSGEYKIAELVHKKGEAK